jgi:hypothetical protein
MTTDIANNRVNLVKLHLRLRILLNLKKDSTFKQGLNNALIDINLSVSLVSQNLLENHSQSNFSLFCAFLVCCVD